MQNPVWHPAWAGAALAGAVGGVLDDGVLAVKKIRPTGLAICAIFQEAVARLVKKPLKRLHLQLQRLTLVHVATPVQMHIAPRLGQVARLVVVHAVRADDGVGPAQLGMAVDGRVQLGTARHQVAAQERRQHTAHLAWQGFEQQAAVLQLHRRDLRAAHVQGLFLGLFLELLRGWRLLQRLNLLLRQGAGAQPGHAQQQGQWFHTDRAKARPYREPGGLEFQKKTLKKRDQRKRWACQPGRGCAVHPSWICKIDYP